MGRKSIEGREEELEEGGWALEMDKIHYIYYIFMYETFSKN